MAFLIIVDIDQFTIIQSISFTRDLGNKIKKDLYLHYYVNDDATCIPREICNIKVKGLNIYGLRNTTVNISIINIRTLRYLIIDTVNISNTLIANRHKLPPKIIYNFKPLNSKNYINDDELHLLFLIRGYYFS